MFNHQQDNTGVDGVFPWWWKTFCCRKKTFSFIYDVRTQATVWFINLRWLLYPQPRKHLCSISKKYDNSSHNLQTKPQPHEHFSQKQNNQFLFGVYSVVGMKLCWPGSSLWSPECYATIQEFRVGKRHLPPSVVLFSAAPPCVSGQYSRRAESSKPP